MKKFSLANCYRLCIAGVRVSPHAFDRINDRLTPEVRTLVDSRIQMLGKLVSNPKEYAIELYKHNEQKSVADPSKPLFDRDGNTNASNGDMVVGVFRGGECKTVMLRRAPEVRPNGQPFNAEALRTKYAYRWNQAVAKLQEMNLK